MLSRGLMALGSLTIGAIIAFKVLFFNARRRQRGRDTPFYCYGWLSAVVAVGTDAEVSPAGVFSHIFFGRFSVGSDRKRAA
jgi:hypothetical protein